MNQIALQESFMWAQDLYPVLKQYESDGSSFYKVLANHADIRNLNGRVYTAKELQAAASSLSERPLNINHDPASELPFPENQVLAARYEDGVVECIIQVSDRKTKTLIDSGEISKVSVEGLYLNEANNTKDTEYPTSLHFRALALLTSDDSPGDPLTTILKDHTISEGRTIIEKIILDGEWSNSFVNELPDSSFAAISPGGKKDEQGKTTPRSLRHLPYKDANGNINKAHLQNALARLSQTELSPQLKSAARKKLVSAAKQVGIETSMDEAYRNFKIAKEILRAILDDDDDSDADKDRVANPAKSEDQEIPNPQTDYSKADAVRLDPQTVPGGTTSKMDAEVAGPVKETPEMDPEKMNPGLKKSPTAITNEHLTQKKKAITVTISK